MQALLNAATTVAARPAGARPSGARVNAWRACPLVGRQALQQQAQGKRSVNAARAVVTW